VPFAARVTDPTTHGAPLAPGPGAVNVLIGSMPAWRATIDQHACPAASVSGADGVGSVLMGSPTVLINNQMACRQMDIVVEKPGLALGPANPILLGCPTVMIGVAALIGVEIVPDDFIGPLAPNQMRESDAAAALATLERIARGDSQIKILGTPLYRGQALAALARLMSRPTGRGLVNDLDGAPHSTTIRTTAGGNSENAANWNAGLYDTANGRAGPGSDNTVDWNADRNKIDGEPWQTRDPAIGLGHELVHSHNDVHGTTDGRNSVNYTDADGNARNSPGYELQAAGVGSHSGDPYTENKMRAEHDGTVSTTGQQEPQRPRY
jgi:uncharacterized Zn-binding protein involved in type VI secretion